jgi:hypothetical protein
MGLQPVPPDRSQLPESSWGLQIRCGNNPERSRTSGMSCPASPRISDMVLTWRRIARLLRGRRRRLAVFRGVIGGSRTRCGGGTLVRGRGSSTIELTRPPRFSTPRTPACRFRTLAASASLERALSARARESLLSSVVTSALRPIEPRREDSKARVPRLPESSVPFSAGALDVDSEGVSGTVAVLPHEPRPARAEGYFLPPYAARTTARRRRRETTELLTTNDHFV